MFTKTGNDRPDIVPHKDCDHQFVRDYNNGLTKQEAEKRIREMLKLVGSWTNENTTTNMNCVKNQTNFDLPPLQVFNKKQYATVMCCGPVCSKAKAPTASILSPQFSTPDQTNPYSHHTGTEGISNNQ